jgi:hypothetical protein
VADTKPSPEEFADTSTVEDDAADAVPSAERAHWSGARKPWPRLSEKFVPLLGVPSSAVTFAVSLVRFRTPQIKCGWRQVFDRPLDRIEVAVFPHGELPADTPQTKTCCWRKGADERPFVVPSCAGLPTSQMANTLQASYSSGSVPARVVGDCGHCGHRVHATLAVPL